MYGVYIWCMVYTYGVWCIHMVYGVYIWCMVYTYGVWCVIGGRGNVTDTAQKDFFTIGWLVGSDYIFFKQTNKAQKMAVCGE